MAVPKAAGPLPLAINQGHALTNNQPYLGAHVAVIPVTVVNANMQVLHALRVVPNRVEVIDIGTNTAFATPLKRGSSAWSATSVFLSFPSTSASVTLAIS